MLRHVECALGKTHNRQEGRNKAATTVQAVKWVRFSHCRLSAPIALVLFCPREDR